MLIKRAKLKIEASSVIDRDMLLHSPKKTAFVKHDIGKNLLHASNKIDVVAELNERDPQEWVILRARAIDAGGLMKNGSEELIDTIIHGANDNGDFFSEEELLNELETGLKSYETFIDCSFFCNHENQDIEKARGKIVNAFYDLDNHCVWCDALIDAKAYPELARGIRQGYITDVSMGCSVKYSNCSICGHKAHTEDEYCSHIRSQKGRKIGGKEVFEINHGIKFIELSAVTDGACENCTIQSAYTGDEFLGKLDELMKVSRNNSCGLRKVATASIVSEDEKYYNDKKFDIVDNLLSATELYLSTQAHFKSSGISKIANSDKVKFLVALNNIVENTIKDTFALQKMEALRKEARGEDVDKLNQALDLLKSVADQILNSKDVDYEFLEDIGSLLSELQNLIVDLVEAGFANQEGAEPAQPQEGATPESPMTPEAPEAAAPEATPAPEAPAPGQAPPMPMSGGQMTNNMMASENNKNNKYANYLKGLTQAKSEINSLVANINSLSEENFGGEGMPTSKERARLAVANKIGDKFSEILKKNADNNEPIVVKSGNYSVTINFEKGIKAFAGKSEVASFEKEELGDEIFTAIKLDPELVAQKLIEQVSAKYQEDGEIKMSGKDTKITKEALVTNAPPQHQVGEGQLQDMSGNFEPQWDGSEKAEGQLGVTTEGQLAGTLPKTPETGKGSWDRVRPNDSKEENLTVTEGQLDDSRPTNWGSERAHPGAAMAEGQLGAVQEGQLAMSNFGSERWDNDARDGEKLPITEEQFEGKDRLGVAVDEVQEGQLPEWRQGDSGETDSSDASPHKNASDHSSRVVEAFVDSLSDVVLRQRVAPKTVANLSPSIKGIKTPATKLSATASKKLTKEDLTKIIEASISNALGVNKDLAEPYLAETIEVLYSDKDVLAEEIAKVAQDKIDAISKAARNESENDTVEEERKSAIASVWNARRKKEAAVSKTHTFVFNAIEDLNAESQEQVNSDITNGIIKKKVAEELGVNPDSIVGSQLNYDPATQLVTVNVSVRSAHPQEEGKSPLTPQNDPLSAPSQPASVDGGGVEEGVGEPEGIELAAGTKDKIEKLAQQKKEAQSPAGTTMPPPAPATGPAPAAGGGVEALTNPADDVMGDELGGDMEEDIEDEGPAEAKPFGFVSPVSGSEDVEFVDGHYRDNSTGVEYDVEVNYTILNPEKANVAFEDQGGEEEMTEEENADEAVDEMNEAINAEPTAMEAPGIPPAGGAQQQGGMGGGGPLASAPGWVKEAHLKFAMKIPHNIFICSEDDPVIKKNASIKPLGQTCPSCGTQHTAFKNSEGLCGGCGTRYYVAVNGHEDDKVLADLYVLPNLMLKDEKNEYGGHAFAGTVEDQEQVDKMIHQILASKENFVKIASSVNDPWVSCINDQSGNGFDGEDVIKICASIKDIELKKIAMMDEEESNDLEVQAEEEDNVEFEDEPKDDMESPEETEDDGFEEVSDEGEEDLEEIEDETGMDLDNDEEIGEDDGFMEDTNEVEVDVDSISTVTLEGTDVTGEPFEVKIPVSGGDDMGDDMGMGEPDDMVEVEEVIEGTPDEIGEIMDGEEEEVGDDDIMSGLFSDGLPDEPEDDMFEEDEEDEEMGMGMSYMSHGRMASNIDLLRQGRVGSSDRSGGSALDFNKLAQALGMPLDVTENERTNVDIPRDKEVGIREDGEALGVTDHENEAKDMEGTPYGNAAGSTVAQDDAVQGAERGVEVVKPQEGRQAKKADWVKVALDKFAKEDEKKCKKCDCAPCECKKASKKDITKEAEGAEENDKLYKDKRDGQFPELDAEGKGKGKKEVGDYSKTTGKAEDGKGKGKEKEECSSGQTTASSKKNVKKAQATQSENQNEPTDSGDRSDPDLKVPRNESKAKPDTFDGRDDVNSPDEVRDGSYGMGPEGKNVHTKNVPRDGSGDGVGGKSTEFVDEKGEGHTSGNPDSYVQDFTESEKPAKAGSEDNHATRGPNTADVQGAIKHLAKSEGLKEANLEAQVQEDGTIIVLDLSTDEIYKMKQN